MKAMTMLSWALVLGLAGAVRGELTPEEVAVTAMARSPESRQLAEYYAKARGIPESHIFLLPGRVGDSISRAAWEEEFRPAIRAWLKKNETHASFDSELSLLFWPEYPLDRWIHARLEDGIAATLGPVAEPYLVAFPPPDDFFPLLLTGRYTLVETYYRTKPFNS